MRPHSIAGAQKYFLDRLTLSSINEQALVKSGRTWDTPGFRHRGSSPVLPKSAINLAMGYHRRIPIGAELQKAGGTHFRVWSTTASGVGIRVADNPELTENAITVDLEPEETVWLHPVGGAIRRLV
jgi:hypothetical protein